MSYSIRYSNLTKPAITIEDGEVNQQTDLKIIGRGVSGYGEHVAQNFLHLLENFANDTAPSNPVAGQQWYDTVEQFLKVYNGTEWVIVNSNMISGININVIGTLATVANLPPHPYDGELGDAYVILENGHLYVATRLNPVVWEDFGQFVGYTGSAGRDGVDGVDGQDGTSINVVTTVETEAELPDPYTGNIGDTIITVNNNHFHVLTELNPVTWTDIGSISGYTGSQGQQGTQGPIGYTGSSANSQTQPLAEWIAGTSELESLVSPVKVKAAIDTFASQTSDVFNNYYVDNFTNANEDISQSLFVRDLGELATYDIMMVYDVSIYNNDNNYGDASMNWQTSEDGVTWTTQKQITYFIGGFGTITKTENFDFRYPSNTIYKNITARYIRTYISGDNEFRYTGQYVHYILNKTPI